MLKVYLAGPEVFLPDAIELGHKKKALCRSCNLEGLYPMDNELMDTEAHPGVNEGTATAIFRGNIAMMREADAVLANLTPFRGVSADPGTVFEIGFAFGLGKPVHGYSHAADTLMDRVAHSQHAPPRRSRVDGRRYGSDDFAVEDFGLSDNLMISEAIKRSGGVFLARDIGSWRDLSLFREAVQAVASAVDQRAATAA